MLEARRTRSRRKATPEFDPRFAEELRRLAENDELDPAFRALAHEPAERDRHRPGDRRERRSRRHPCGAAGAAGLPWARDRRAVAEAASRAAPPKDLFARRGERRAARLRARGVGAPGGGRRDVGRRPPRPLRGGGEPDRPAGGAPASRAFRARSRRRRRSSASKSRYRDNALVLDKWFTVQATAPRHAALEAVETLTAHPAFSFKNPNRVYALVRSFAAFNPVGFNRPDGAGYRFIARRHRRPRPAEPFGRGADRHRLPLVADA